MRNLPVDRTHATEYRPKWGLYRAVSTGIPRGDDYLDRENLSAEETDHGSSDSVENLVADALRYTTNSTPRHVTTKSSD